MRAWRPLEGWTTATNVVSLPNASRFLLKQSEFTCTSLCKWVLSEATSESLFHVAFSTSNPYLIKWYPVTKTGSSMTLTSVPDIVSHYETLYLTLQDQIYSHARTWFVYSGLVDKGCTMSCYQRAKKSLWTFGRSSWNVCKQTLKEKEPVRVYCTSMRMSSLMWRGWPWIPYGDLARRHCVTYLTPRTLHQKNYYIFHILGNHYRRKYFGNGTELWQEFRDFFASKTPDFHCQSIAQLKARRQKILEANGDYFWACRLSNVLDTFFFLLNYERQGICRVHCTSE